jgi:protein KTI12
MSSTWYNHLHTAPHLTNISYQLIIVSGLPTSGKSTRANQLHDYLSKRIADTKYRLHLISDESLSISRTVYDLSPDKVRAHTRSANASEKDARAAIYGAVKRVLSDKDIVILDGLNYIKGWRYQLHCESKAVRTPSCILQIGCSVDKAREVNENRIRKKEADSNNVAAEGGEAAPAATDSDEALVGSTEPYEPDNWDNLVFRYEEPNPMTRWDSPLFTLIWEDDEAQTTKVFSDLWDAIAGEARKVVRPNQATIQRGREESGDYLYLLDRETSDVVKLIVEAQREGDDVDEVRIPSGSNELTIYLPAGKKVGLPQLQRLRRAFMGLNRGGIGLEAVGDMKSSRLRDMFVTYLNDAFEKDE